MPTSVVELGLFWLFATLPPETLFILSIRNSSIVGSSVCFELNVIEVSHQCAVYIRFTVYGVYISSIYIYSFFLCLFSVVVVYIEPSTTVLGGSEVFVGMGSTINLTCVIRLSPEPPNSIRWQHNNQVYDLLVHLERETFIYVFLTFSFFFIFHWLVSYYQLSFRSSLFMFTWNSSSLSHSRSLLSQLCLLNTRKEEKYLNQHAGGVVK